MELELPRRTFPIAHTVVVVAGWVAYPFLQHVATLVIAGLLTLLAIPRFIRGQQERGDIRAEYKLSRPKRPRNRTARHIHEHEDFMFEICEHPIALLWWWLGGALWTAGAVALGMYWDPAIASMLWVGGMAVLSIRIMLWRLDKICVTTKRIFAVRGLIGRRLFFVPLEKVTDTVYGYPWHSGLLAKLRLIGSEYGPMRLQTAGEGSDLTHMVFIPHIVQVNKIIGGKAFE